MLLEKGTHLFNSTGETKCHGRQEYWYQTVHIILVQRGHNHKVVFFADEDYRYYLKNLKKWKQKLGIKLNAWCLMTNYIHVIASSREAIGSSMKLNRESDYVSRTAAREDRRMKLNKCAPNGTALSPKWQSLDNDTMSTRLPRRVTPRNDMILLKAVPFNVSRSCYDN